MHFDELLAGIGPWTLYIAAIFAFIGAFFLTPLMRHAGILLFIVNCLLLFASAVAGNVLGRDVMMPLDSALQKPILMSLAGMTVMSVILIILFVRPSRN